MLGLLGWQTHPTEPPVVGNAASILSKRIIRKQEWVMYAILFPESNAIGMVFNDLLKESRILGDFRRVVGVQSYNYNACFFRILALMGKGLSQKKCLKLRRRMKPISHVSQYSVTQTNSGSVIHPRLQRYDDRELYEETEDFACGGRSFFNDAVQPRFHLSHCCNFFRLGMSNKGRFGIADFGRN